MSCNFSNFVYYDENNNKVEHLNIEIDEQRMADQYIRPDDVVLELGARYGTVSCIINHKLNNKNNLVVVEPDNRVWDVLENNMKNNNGILNVAKVFILY